MKKKGLYQLKKSDKKIKEYTLSVLTEDKAGLLNHITIICLLYTSDAADE